MIAWLRAVPPFLAGAALAEGTLASETWANGTFSSETTSSLPERSTRTSAGAAAGPRPRETDS